MLHRTIELERTVTIADLLSDFRGHLRITGTAQDTDLTRYLGTVALQFEDQVSRLLVVGTVKEHYDDWPWLYYRDFALQRSPVTSFTSVKYYDSDGVQQTWDSANYDTDLVSEPCRVKVADDATLSYPGLEANRYNAVTLEYESGIAADVASLPADIVNALFSKAAFLYAPGREAGYVDMEAVDRAWWHAIRRYQWKVS